MGWNSWNSFATTITEAQALETAAIMARKLLPAGYDIFTVDIQWYDPAAKSYTYNAKPAPTLDGLRSLAPGAKPLPLERRRGRASNRWQTPFTGSACASVCT